MTRDDNKRFHMWKTFRFGANFRCRQTLGSATAKGSVLMDSSQIIILNGCRYNLEVDTSKMSPEECAEAIQAAMDQRT